ncbi:MULTISPECIES: hypothetical protein [Alicyclobacillus]|uniref:Uncharacterized protein n=1 Tax=Alicyclobacillus vulcanalis TaxID=252246 RepID=A0A1N7PGU7_9BACL|nr:MULTISPECIES: hypothetical protein [Alicyclobacillus]SIT09740.1 hypothetical protein SAMN05421799_11351 [Alicyclobacillus vulcanalis]
MMRWNWKVAVGSLALAALGAGAAVSPVFAAAKSSKAAQSHAEASAAVVMAGKLYGNIPNVTIRGVEAGKAPWVVDGSYQLKSNLFTASGKWLIIPKQGYMENGQPVPAKIGGTTNNIPAVGAEITFANAAPIVLPPVKLSSQGDFSFHDAIQWPKGAAQPVILIGPEKNGQLVAWFAASDFLADYGQATGMGGGWVNAAHPETPVRHTHLASKK